MRAVCADFETELAEFNGESNHVHLLVNFPPKVALARAGEQPQGRVLPPAAAGIPGPAAALLAGEPAVVRSYFAGTVGGAPDHCPAAVHRAAEPARPTGSASVRLHHRPEGRRTSGPLGSGVSVLRPFRVSGPSA